METRRPEKSLKRKEVIGKEVIGKEVTGNSPKVHLHRLSFLNGSVL